MSYFIRKNLKNVEFYYFIVISLFFMLQLEWSFGKGIMFNTHKNYFEEFGNKFFDDIKNCIKFEMDQMPNYENNLKYKYLIEEIIEHLNYAHLISSSSKYKNENLVKQVYRCIFDVLVNTV